MSATKRYNLAINEDYELIDSYYTSKIIDGGGTCCDNCSRLISNISVIKDSKGSIYNVGLDCAETLTNLKGLFSVSNEFAEMKAIRAKVNKAIKNNSEIDYFINNKGDLQVMGNGFNVSKDLDFANKYLKDYVKNVSNPEKIGYIPFEISVTKLPFERCMPKEFLNKTIDFNIDNFKVVVSGVYSDFIRKDGIKNIVFKIEIFLNNEIIYTKNTYMYSDILGYSEYAINVYLFNQFNKNPIC